MQAPGIFHSAGPEILHREGSAFQVPAGARCPVNTSATGNHLSVTELSRIRNFSIIAHIDHGKSTLADRFIQVCGADRPRNGGAGAGFHGSGAGTGITIKAQSVTLNYKARDGIEYKLNFIDTPGHVDFSYEVSRSLYACEGALLVVDAGQGVEAQSVANCYTAIEQGLEVVPVLNKMDLPQAEPERVAQEIEDIIGIEAQDAVRCSAKSGMGVEDVLEDLIKRIPPPVGDEKAPLQALIIDSWFDNYLGVVSLVRIRQGVMSKGTRSRSSPPARPGRLTGWVFLRRS